MDPFLPGLELFAMRTPPRSSRFFVLTIASLVITTALGIVAFVQSSGAGERPPATEFFSIFSTSPPSPAAIRESRHPFSRGKPDLSQLRIVASGLGKFGSRLEVFPANDARSVCFHLFGATSTDPAMQYCFSPNSPYAPPKTAGEHFSVVALESATDGQIRVQVFGVAFDDVAKVRVQVAGEWKSIPLARNGFYLDLPGVGHEQVGIFEATLSHGAVQRHDIQTGSRVP